MIKTTVMAAIRTYQAAISPFLGSHCRFHPSCSEYTRQAVMEKGVLDGLAAGSRRLLRCHPFSTGGWDPVE